MTAHLVDLASIANASRIAVEADIRARCAGTYLGNHEALCRCLGRYKMFLDTRDVGFAPHIMLDGVWEFWITRFIVKSFRAGSHVIDVGANFGYYSLLFSDLVGHDGRCIAVEPNPHAAAKLRKTIDINGYLDRTRVEELAIGRASGEINLYVPDGEPKNARVVPSGCRAEPPDTVVQVKATTLDELCAGTARLDFIKIDAEGAEVDIIAGASATLDRLRPNIVLEFNAGRAGAAEMLKSIQQFYRKLQYIDYNAKLQPVTPIELFSRNVGTDWMLFLAQ